MYIAFRTLYCPISFTKLFISSDFQKKLRSGRNLDAVPLQLAMVVPVNMSNKHTTEKIRNDVYHKLLEISEDGVLPFGGITRVANEFSIHRSVVSRLWKQASAQRALGLSISQAIAKKTKKGTYPLKYIPELISDQISEIPLLRRKTIRDAAEQLGISKTTLHRTMQKSYNCKNV